MSKRKGEGGKRQRTLLGHEVKQKTLLEFELKDGKAHLSATPDRELKREKIEMEKKRLKDTYNIDGKVSMFPPDLTDQNLGTAETIPETEKRTKVPSQHLDALFTTADSMKNMIKDDQFTLFNIDETRESRGLIKERMEVMIKEGYQGLILDYDEDRVMKALFNLANDQKANTAMPWIKIKSRREIYDLVLEKNYIKKLKTGYEFKDFSQKDMQTIDRGLEKLSTTFRKFIAKIPEGFKGKDPSFRILITKKPLIEVVYVSEAMRDKDLKKYTDQDIIEKGGMFIKFMPDLLKNWDKYFREVPIDIVRKIKKANPEIKKVSLFLQRFGDWLYRHGKNRKTVEINRESLIKTLGISEQKYKKRKKRHNEEMIRTYEAYKKAGILLDYKIDQKGHYSQKDVFNLNPDEFYHLKDERKPIEKPEMDGFFTH